MKIPKTFVPKNLKEIDLKNSKNKIKDLESLILDESEVNCSSQTVYEVDINSDEKKVCLFRIIQIFNLLKNFCSKVM